MERPAATITSEDVKRLREMTGAGVMDCKRALQESGGDLAEAAAWLQRQGLAGAAKKSGRAADDGVIASYIHHGARLGVLVEVNCETDFVARTEDFQGLARELAMQVAGMSPEFVSREDVPAERLAGKREELVQAARAEGRPEERIDTIVQGRLTKWLESVCLLDQPYRDTDRKVSDLIAEKVALLGENIRVARFSRMAVGETSDGTSPDR
ncbi:MAG: translation elongation factor Ts [Candidatus Limnocylindria bacterium]